MYSWKVSLPFCGWVFTVPLSSAVWPCVFVLFWYNLICPFLLFCYELFECPIQKVFAYAYIFKYFPLLGSVSSFKLKPISMLSRLLYRAEDGNMVSFFYMQIYQIFQHSLLKMLSFSNVWSGNLCQKSDDCSCVGLSLGGLFYFLLHWSTCLVLCCFLLWWLCSIISD